MAASRPIFPPSTRRLAMTVQQIDRDRLTGAMLGAAAGDALGMPVDGLSHPHVRTYYRGIKGLRADEKRGDLEAGQWTGHTQRALALARALADPAPSLRERYGEELARLRPHARRWTEEPAFTTSAAAAAAAPLGLWWAASGAGEGEALARVREAFGPAPPAALAAALGQAFAVRYLLAEAPDDLDGPAFLEAVTEMTGRAEAALGGAAPSPAERLRALAPHLGAFPLDLQDRCDGTGPAADEAWPFAVAMLARNPRLLDATLLPAINVGGAASATGAMVGALLGALHGWAAFPADWREGLEDAAHLEAEAARLADALRL